MRLESCSAALLLAIATPEPLPGQPIFPPWKTEADCYWVLTHPDGVAHRAWISSAAGGLFLSIVDDSMRVLPVSDSLQVALVPDQAIERSTKARGSHRDGDGATLLTIVLDQPQRALIAGARNVAIQVSGGPSFVLPMRGAPQQAALDACGPDEGPGRFSNE